MFDTHSHLNFSRFKKNFNNVILEAKEAGVSFILIPGTDVPSSEKALQIALSYENIYASSGIHPHHVFSYLPKNTNDNLDFSKIIDAIKTDIELINKIIDKSEKVVAVGEIGIDLFDYNDTKYSNYNLSNVFLEAQTFALKLQIEIAISKNKALILHNREGSEYLLQILREKWRESLYGRVIFHCCEENEQILQFALKNGCYIGVDGDATYSLKKQDFLKEVPVENLLLETDSPFLLPEPLKSEKKYPNEPKNLHIIATTVSKIKKIPVNELVKITTNNAKKVFKII